MLLSWLLLAGLWMLWWRVHVWRIKTVQSAALFEAVLNRNPRAVQDLLKQGAEADQRTEIGDLPGFWEFS